MNHEWLPTIVTGLMGLLMTFGGVAFHSTVRSLIVQGQRDIGNLKSEYETAIREAEDNVVAFIRKHETDPYAHPNSVALQEIKAEIRTEMRAVAHQIQIMREALVAAKLIHVGVKGNDEKES